MDDLERKDVVLCGDRERQVAKDSGGRVPSIRGHVVVFEKSLE